MSSQTAFVSGHTDLARDDFERIYIPLLDAALRDGHSFIVGDAAGVDSLVLAYLLSEVCLARNPDIRERVTVFASRKQNVPRLQALGIKVVGPESHSLQVSASELEELIGAQHSGRDVARHRHLVRDTHMTLSSDYDILFVRSDEQSKGFYGEKWRPRISATELNRQRRSKMLQGSQTHQNSA